MEAITNLSCMQAADRADADDPQGDRNAHVSDAVALVVGEPGAGAVGWGAGG